MSAKLSKETIDNNSKKAEAEVSEALLELGRRYYEAHKDGGALEFREEVARVSELMEAHRLWSQYKLNLDGKMLCENCGAVITDDSLFCNKCGSQVTKPDFSVLDITAEEPAPELPKKPAERLCPSCGRKLLPNAKFCEKCGTAV
ncbi:MAG: zinc ribbon domain-containing protein [Lachnospiraceae bacterium]|nr:zinc ribbon domain-containing protein [Lachnospiraceae bacterium]